MKMLEKEGKPMSAEGVLLALVVILFVFAWYLYANRDKTGGEIAAQNYGEVKELLLKIEARQGEEKKELEAVANTMATTIADLTARIEKLEKQDPNKNINVHLPPLRMEPIQVEVVTRELHPKPLFKDDGPQFNKAPTSKTPLLKRAKENN